MPRRRDANCSVMLHDNPLRRQFGKITGLPHEPIARYYFCMDTEEEESAEIPLLIRRIIPDATEAQLLEATAILEDYLAIAWRIMKRLARENGTDSSPGHL